MIQVGAAIFQYIYYGPDTTLSEIRYQYNMFSRKAAAGLIIPETPTEGAAAQHSLRTYLQTRDWILLHTVALETRNLGTPNRRPT